MNKLILLFFLFYSVSAQVVDVGDLDVVSVGSLDVVDVGDLFIRPAIQNFQEPKPSSLSGTGLVVAYNFIPTGSVLVDIAGTSNGTITGTYKTVDGMSWDGVDDRVVLSASVDLTTATYNFRLTPKSFTAFPHIISDVSNSLDFIRFDTDGKIRIEAHTGGDQDVFDYVFLVNQTYNITITSSSSTWTLYVNGVAEDTFDLSTSAFHFSVIGGLSSGSSRQYSGEMEDLQIYNIVLTEPQIIAYHNSFADDVATLERFEGKTLSVSPDFDWTVGTGTYEVVEASVNGVTQNVLNCSSAGTIYLPSDQAYGTWEFDVLKGGDANNLTMWFTSESFPIDNWYRIQFDFTELVKLSRDGGTLFTTATSYFNINQWLSVIVTRTTAGVFTVYLDDVLVSTVGGSGTNPTSADNTYTTSNYLVLDLDANDRVANFKFSKGVIQ